MYDGRTDVRFPFNNLYRGEPIAYHDRIVRTRPLSAGIGVTSAPTVIDGVDRLRSFLNGARHDWQWDDARLNEVIEAYDARFFEDRILAAGVVSAGSGSTKVTISDVTRTEAGILIILRLQAPSIGTADMMSWHYFVELFAEDVGDSEVLINLPLSKGVRNPGMPGRIIADR